MRVPTLCLIALAACGPAAPAPAPTTSTGGGSATTGGGSGSVSGGTGDGGSTGVVSNTSGVPNTTTGGTSGGTSGGGTSGGGTAGCSASTATATDQMAISGFVISPSCMLVTRSGGGSASVTVTNHDSAPHDLAAQAGSSNAFDTGTIGGNGGQQTVTLTHAGTTTVYCSLHASMTPVTLIVQ